MASIKLKGDTSGEITIQAPSVAGTNTLNLQASSGTLATTAQASVGTKNLIINGDMRIDQRYVGSATANTISGYVTDRWQVAQSTTGKLIAQQVTDAPSGSTHSLKITSQSAYTVGTSDAYYVRQAIEGQNCSHLLWGSSSAKTVTLSFWVKSSLTGTFGGTFFNKAYNRSYAFEYTISSANTWEQKSITITGDTTGTWDTDNTFGIGVSFGLGAGSTNSGTAGSWSASGATNTSGATSIVGTNGATWYITGIQLEASTEATPFENRMYSTELAMCQRYFEKSYSDGTAIGTASVDGRQGVGGAQGQTTTSAVGSYIYFRVQKRTTPTIITYDSAGASGKIDRPAFGAANSTGNTSNVYETNDAGFIGYSASGTAAHCVGVHYTANSEL
jgi:hypothetical protein